MSRRRRAINPREQSGIVTFAIGASVVVILLYAAKKLSSPGP